MANNHRFSCCLIGANVLLRECASVLLRQGHEIRSILTDSRDILDWAEQRNIATFSPRFWLNHPPRQPFDYLFSITHLEVLPPEALALPLQGAINFHDGPLPRYAGLNTPVWALINGEKEYGITWHLMTEKVDRGAVLMRKTVAVSADETALSLNTKCFHAGLESFAELAELLASNRPRSQPQGGQTFHYYGRYDRPAAAGVIDWQRDAASIAALVRALFFGRYPNPIGLPTLFRERRVLAVTRAETRPGEAALAPGTVVGVDANEILVATVEGLLAITELCMLSGRRVSPRDAVAQLGLEAGVRLDRLSGEEAARLEKVHAQLCRSEAFWLKRLLDPRPALPPLMEKAGSEKAPARWRTFAVALPAALLRGIEARQRPAALIAAFALYWSRITESEPFSFGFSSSRLRSRIEGFEAWIADQVHFRGRVTSAHCFTKALQVIASELRLVERRLSWKWDLHARHPELAASEPERMPIAVELYEGQLGLPPHNGACIWAVSETAAEAALHFDLNLMRIEDAENLHGHFEIFLRSLARYPTLPAAALAIISPAERQRLVHELNRTEIELEDRASIHQAFERQVRRTPDQAAVSFRDTTLGYEFLNREANRIAHYLREKGIGPEKLVGVALEHETSLLTALLAVLKAGAAYVPLDPSYPPERLSFMTNDAGLAALLSRDSLAISLATRPAVEIKLDRHGAGIATRSTENPAHRGGGAHPAYVIYTSGSTGNPKGVLVPHGAVLSFFQAMDAPQPAGPPGTLVGTTSLSFDISVLELFWTLCRGFHVVLHRERPMDSIPATSAGQPMDFSLFFFSSDEGADRENKYRLLMEGAAFADRHEFKAVWTPERHFHAFGGLYPDPAITGAAVAAVTRNVGIRAGSVVLPLHHPVRVAEAWAVVDNLSHGRVGISVAAGWQPNDFLLMPQNYGHAKETMFREIETVRRLWRGETLRFSGATGDPVKVRTLPRPIQKELPVWVTTAGNIETYKRAGEIGAHLLTHLLGQSVAQLAAKIQAYRRARAEHGHDPDAGIVSLMLHTFVGDDEPEVRDIVGEPLRRYLGSSLSLLKQYGWAFPVFTRPASLEHDPGNDFAGLTQEEREAMLDHAFERYYETSGLFGDTRRCLQLIDRLKHIGVNEVACLIDFGVPTQTVLDHLGFLDELRRRANPMLEPRQIQEEDPSLLTLIARKRATHLQCTPSLARLLLTEAPSGGLPRCLRHVMVGGEALPLSLATDLRAAFKGKLTNMYGPTETTIWSATQSLEDIGDSVPIGKPIANTQCYLLDSRGALLPEGFAGELFIGGHGVVRGYHGRPDLTAERFLPDRFSGREGDRLYRCGDRVRLRRDGSMEFLGRMDHQVKVRGYRIEPGDIESHLLDHPSIRQAVVVAHGEPGGGMSLTAYVVTADATIDEDGLRAFLVNRLPRFMVPGGFELLDKLPLTPNGKIDRAALPKPGRTRSRTLAAYAAPQGEMQEKIVNLWQELLGRDRVGIDDRFFDIGGHSLLVVRMHRRLTALLEKPISLTDLYRFPTVRTLSEFLSAANEPDGSHKSVDRARRRRKAMNRRARHVRPASS